MLHLFIGPMFSGKTTTLISRLERYKIGGKRCIVIKYDKDVRYDNEKICSHSQIKHEAIQTNLLEKVHTDVVEYDVIMIDEIQFFIFGMMRFIIRLPPSLILLPEILRLDNHMRQLIARLDVLQARQLNS